MNKPLLTPTPLNFDDLQADFDDDLNSALEEDNLMELLDTGSVSIEHKGKVYELSLSAVRIDEDEAPNG